ncbi:M23 family metallopeptidase [Oryzobacter sp. R7]|uniref:M23 family metallopeptidase n=1 Tax=Oryzobacter faecalis TaxID=3388656 RepID=UPI00398D0A2F
MTALLPTVTAAALVLGSGGVSLAQTTAGDRVGVTTTGPAPVIDLSVEEAVAVAVEEAAGAATTRDLAQRRSEAAIQVSAVRGGAEARVRAARDAKRKAVAEAKRKVAERRSREKAAAKARARAEAKARAQRQRTRWVEPIRTGRLTSDFGPRWGKTHDGLDIGAPTGTPLYAMSSGTVILSDEVFSFGNKLEIRYWDGTVSWYGHLSRRLVRTGETVRAGELVGLVGNTGHSFGSHLHLEIHPRGGDDPVDPRPWLARRGMSVG